MTSDEARKRIETEPDFVYMARFSNSLKLLLEKYPDGATNRVIGQALMMTEEEVEDMYESIINRLRDAMGVDIEQQ